MALTQIQQRAIYIGGGIILAAGLIWGAYEWGRSANGDDPAALVDSTQVDSTLALPVADANKWKLSEEAQLSLAGKALGMESGFRLVGLSVLREGSPSRDSSDEGNESAPILAITVRYAQARGEDITELSGTDSLTVSIPLRNLGGQWTPFRGLGGSGMLTLQNMTPSRRTGFVSQSWWQENALSSQPGITTNTERYFYFTDSNYQVLPGTKSYVVEPSIGLLMEPKDTLYDVSRFIEPSSWASSVTLKRVVKVAAPNPVDSVAVGPPEPEAGGRYCDVYTWEEHWRLRNGKPVRTARTLKQKKLGVLWQRAEAMEPEL